VTKDYVTARKAVTARMPTIAKTTRKTKNKILAISAAPAAIPVNPNNPAIAAKTRKNKAHLSRDIESLLTAVSATRQTLVPEGDFGAASGWLTE
jgi:hypothetical protein